MKVLKTSIDCVDERIINEAVNVLANGGVVLYPTDTVYGLGANIFDNKAVKKVYGIKQRSLLKPFSILVKDIESINLVAKVSSAQKNLFNKYLPGPYTFILNKRNIVPRVVTSGLANVGVRVPDCDIACNLAKIFPITTTSANVSDDEMLSNPREILEQLDCDVDLVIDVGDLDSNVPSSIIDLSGFKPKIIRK
ncbi:L-threonylcarbamoyladenylate synthase [Methanobrevibacter gottschalkii]|uniref:L-threonylcarbamoyladenylate synthase n=2 Tax=Methanobrevibacter gottschalkii TaxID=190974 RepID=A0A3N5B7P4_9EURY|nr:MULTISPECIES: L-threonylcarbamoyladenylate synthase [Methanobrevibacter]MCQ2970336.1 threonylcarbamoyl-AMP synthase [archaeon]OEC95261.1 threonylcarbamoyl-AMP synthase [Methanobrevibacter sp. A27]RPF53109.1 L-threonylcarbamoyladenylate synthase [Methanobrevibacter gottschalkii DSM 11977]SEK60941.1 L-threonylcarbamoyladenylate synthase [Methanobrevibacter gottschalkii]